MNDDIAEAVDSYGRSLRSANAGLISSFDSNPDEAAEAVRLGKTTGVPPVLVSNNLDGFKRQQKTSLITDLVESNPYLRDFVANDPMAPKLVHDDIGNLDKLTVNLSSVFDATLTALNPFYSAHKIAKRLTGKPLPHERGFVSTFTQQNPELVGEFLEGWSQGGPGFGQQMFAEGAKALKDLSKLSPEEYKRQQESMWGIKDPLDALSWVLETAGSAVGSASIPLMTGAVGAAAGSVTMGPFGTVAGGVAGASMASYILNYGEVYQALKKAGVDPTKAHTYADMAAIPMAALDAASLSMLSSRFATAAAKREFTDTLTKRVVKELGIGTVTEAGTEAIQAVIKDIAVSVAADKPFGTKEQVKDWVENAVGGAIGGFTFGTGTAVMAAAGKAKPYIDVGKDPPAGIDSTLDKIKADQAAQDMKILDSQLEDAKASQLRERSPEHLSGLLERQIGETDVEISVEAIKKLYGDKQPTIEDGLLGWVPDLAQQLADPGAKYVTVRYRDWLANVEDDVALALHDDILTRPAGVTINEGKVRAAFDVYHGTPHFFDVFDLQYMGTGEGSMVRGAGQYFGQAEGTAKTYQRGKVSTQGEHIAQLALERFKGDRTAALADLDKSSKLFMESSAQYREYRNAINLIKKGWKPSEGFLLKTRIHAELEQFLDLDKPLSEQPILLEVLEKAGVSPADMNLPPAMARASLRELVAKAPQITGETAYKALSDKLGGDVQASEALRQAGIPGSKFLDQFSRQAVTGAQIDIPSLHATIGTRQAYIESVQKLIEQAATPEQAARLRETVAAAKREIKVLQEDIAQAERDVAGATYNIVLFDTTLAQIIERNGQVISSVREAASLGVLTDLGPQAEYLLFQNRLQMQAIMDRLNRAETPEEIAALRQEVQEVQKVLRALGKEATGALTKGAWQIEPTTEQVTITYGKYELDVVPIGVTSLKDVLKQIDLSFVENKLGNVGTLKPVLARITELAADVPVTVVSDAEYSKLLETAGANKRIAAYYSYSVKLKGKAEPDRIVISESTFRDATGAQFVFHEAIHAATTHALEKNPALVRVIKDLMNELEVSDPTLKDTYGYTDEHEFLAEAISNPDFQEKLGSIQLTETMANSLGMEEWSGKTLWQGIVEFVRKALTVPEGAFSALEAALRVTELTMQVQEAGAVGIGAAPTPKAAEGQSRRERLIEHLRSIDLSKASMMDLGGWSQALGTTGRGSREELTKRLREIIAKEGGATPTPKAAKQLELPGLKKVTDQDKLRIFEEARSVGLTNDQYIKIMENIAQQSAEDTAMMLKQVEKFVRKRLTKEWKDTQARVRSEVEEAMLSRPDIALATFFRTGRLYGEQQGIPKINRNDLTPEQRKLIPDRWQSDRGGAANDFAMLVGYVSVDQMALRAALLEEQMVAARQPSLRKYVDGLIREETERRMIKEFGGGLEENIVREAMEHVVSPTQMDRLHEDTVAMGMQNGWTMPFTKAEIVKGVQNTFGKLRAIKVSMEKFLRDAGKAGKLSGIAAEIEKDSTAFFKYRQDQEYALRKAGEAKKLEHEMEVFDNTVKRLGRREARTIEQAHFNYAQGLLNAVGIGTKNTPEEIMASVDHEGHGTLDQFIAAMKGGIGSDLELFIPANYKPKQFDQMTVDEFREFRDAVDALEDAGRRMRQHNINGELREHEDLKADIIAHLIARAKGAVRKGGANIFYMLDSSLARLEEVVKDLDAREDLGPLWWALIHPYSLAKSDEFSLLTEVSKIMKGFRKSHKKWFKTMHDKIPQDFVYDSRNKVFFDLDRWNLVRMMLNWGNESSKYKLAQGIASHRLGYAASEEETMEAYKNIDALIGKHANKEDWEFVTQVWQIFKGWQEREEQVVRVTSSKMPKWIEAAPVYTGFKELGSDGVIEGGYFPLIEDAERYINFQGKGIPKVDAKALMGPDYHRATTSRPHHLARTGAIYFVDITNSPHNIAGRMQQHIHDIAFREFVMDAGKIINDKEIMHNIEKYYGKEYRTQMEDWLYRVANTLTVPEAQLQGFNDVLRFLRQNLVNAVIPLNYAIHLSPTLGVANLRAAQRMYSDPNKKAILANSEELKHVMYTIDRDLTDQLGLVLGGHGAWAKWDLFRRSAVEKIMRGSGLVWFETQSRSVTFYDWFMHHKGEGLSDGEAAALADSKIRERHGVVAPGDLPPLQASDNEFVRTVTVFMGWYSMVRNWQRQIPGQVRRGEYSEVVKTIWGTVIISALFNAWLFTKWKKDDNLWSFWARAIFDTPMQMWPYIKEFWGYETEGRRPSNPLFSFGLAGSKFVQEWHKVYKGRKDAAPIRATFGLAGMGLGVPGAMPIGRTLEGAFDYVTETQKPRNVYELIRLFAQGEARPKR